MSNVLRGRNLSIEQSLSALADALKQELPPHLARLPVTHGPRHNVLISAFVDGEPRVYIIDLVLSPDRTQLTFDHTHWVVVAPSGDRLTHRFTAAGTGASILGGNSAWRRPLLKLLEAYDRQRITAKTVADEFAAVNCRVSQLVRDRTVGPNCIVAWRNRKAGSHRGGGGHQSYTGTMRDRDMPALPIIGNGMDIRALAEVLMPHFLSQVAALREGNSNAQLDTAALDADLAQLPDTPDETLR
jgi:hypothetical protein